MKKRKAISYPTEFQVKTFNIKYDNLLSPIAKRILKSFRGKYLYYAIDDILYLLQSNPVERDNLLSLLYSTVISLQNNLCVSFFDIWIFEIYINEVPIFNKFITQKSQNLESLNYITIKFAYQTRLPFEKVESPW